MRLPHALSSTIPLCLVLAVLTAGGAGIAADSAAPDGYRMDLYRAPTPDSVPGGARVDTAGLQWLLAGPDRPVLIDVMAAAIARQPAPVWLVPEPRMSLPGSTWLPNVGYGELAAETEAYFRHHLERLTGGDHARAIVFYCIADCWMSWNAVRRAASWGYTAIYWYPGGTDDWREAGLALAPACPVPLDPGSGPDCPGS